jgi:hypothetical protein
MITWYRHERGRNLYRLEEFPESFEKSSDQIELICRSALCQVASEEDEVEPTSFADDKAKILVQILLDARPRVAHGFAKMEIG